MYNVITAIVRFLMFFVFRVKTEGKDNVPSEGGVIFAVNHRSNFDPVIAAMTCPRRMTFMAKAELFKNPVFGWFLKTVGAFPIHRGKGDISAIKCAFSILKDGKAMLIFPEGTRVRNGKTSKAQPGVAMIAHRTAAPVVPVCISGDYKWLHKITVSYGKPITLEEYAGQKLTGEETQQIADSILSEIKKLAAK